MSQQIQITGGAKVRDLQDVIIGTSGVLSSVAFDVANGVPKLDSNGKILVSQLPNSVMEYKGTWNAATNTPTLANGTGNQGDVYLCNVAGTVNFGAGPISFIVGDSAVYSGSIWQRSGGATGSVTSVGLSTNAGAITIGNSPITTSGVISANFNGTNLQYVNGAGNLTTFPTLMTSVGLTMPSAFTVTNSPLTGAGGTLSVTGAGTTAQYIRGDGSLATFPTIATEAQRLVTEVYNETGATLTKGTVVYINGGHGNLPTITKAIATGDATSAQTYGIVQTDITNNNNGYVVVIGSLGDLDTQAYANGTQLYLSSTTAGAWTSTKQYAPAHLVYVAIVTRSHPTQGVVEVRIQNGFELDELHNVSAQSPLNNQGLFYNTSTSLWENKSIATALGYTPANDASVVHLTGNETIGGTKTFSDATKNNGGIFLQNASSSSLAGYMNLGGLTNGVKFTSGGGISNTFTLPSATGYTFTFPNATGTLALTSDIPSITGLVPYTGATADLVLGANKLKANSVYAEGSGGSGGALQIKQYAAAAINEIGYSSIGTLTNGYFYFTSSASVPNFKNFALNPSGLTDNTLRTYTLPDASGTIALVGGTGVGTVTSVAALTIGTSGTDLSSTVATSTTTPVITLNVPTASASNRGALSSADWTIFNNKQNALTNPVTGTGTTNYLPKFTGASTIGNSNITDTGSLITLGSNTNISSGALGIATTGFTGYSLRVSKNITGATSSFAVRNEGVVQSDVTSDAIGFRNDLNTAAAAFTLTNYWHFWARQATIGAGSAITNQYGYVVDGNMTGATNNYGFYGNIASGTNRWNLYMNGTANNYMAGSLGIGSTSLSLFGLRISKTITGGTIAYNQFNDGSVQSDVTSEAMYYSTNATTAAAAFTLTNLFHYRCRYNIFGASSAVTNQYGFFVDSTLTAATNNYAFYSSIASGTNRWNLYMAGTAANYMAGDTSIGTTTGGYKLNVNGTIFSSKVTNNAAISNSPADASLLLYAPTTTNYYGGIIGWAEGNLAASISAYDDGFGGALGLSFSAGNATTLSERLKIKSTGQMRFIPLASDPSGAEAGDVYYNSTTNALKLYDGTVWRTITVV